MSVSSENTQQNNLENKSFCVKYIYNDFRVSVPVAVTWQRLYQFLSLFS